MYGSEVSVKAFQSTALFCKINRKQPFIPHISDINQVLSDTFNLYVFQLTQLRYYFALIVSISLTVSPFHMVNLTFSANRDQWRVEREHDQSRQAFHQPTGSRRTNDNGLQHISKHRTNLHHYWKPSSKKAPKNPLGSWGWGRGLPTLSDGGYHWELRREFISCV